jgi:hypothetical protein
VSSPPLQIAWSNERSSLCSYAGTFSAPKLHFGQTSHFADHSSSGREKPCVPIRFLLERDDALRLKRIRFLLEHAARIPFVNDAEGSRALIHHSAGPLTWIRT